MGEGNRGQSIEDQERAALRNLLSQTSIQTFGDMTDRGHPATYFTNPDGTFMLVCTRISKAIERVDPGVPSTDETPSGSG